MRLCLAKRNGFLARVPEASLPTHVERRIENHETIPKDRFSGHCSLISAITNDSRSVPLNFRFQPEVLMSTRRTARVASVIREVVSLTILQELRDPRIQNVTVLGVQVSPDLRYAQVNISVMGDEKEQALTLHGLNSAKGYLQSKVADRVKTRYTPELRFDIDQGVKKSVEAARILREVLPPEDDADKQPVQVDESQQAD